MNIAYVAVMTSHVYELAEQLGHRLLNLQLKITTAESCTGGGLSHALTSVAGCSAWFEAAFVTYSNQMKNRILGVPCDLIDSHGAVSQEVASAMLSGAMVKSGADLGIAVTGIAGPSGGSAEKPVGTVCIAYGAAGDIRIEVEKFEGDRDEIRNQTLVCALHLAIAYCQDGPLATKE